jgi:hypothetical protein
MREGFQRRIDEQSAKFAAQLTHAERLATRLECGEVVGVYNAEIGGGISTRAYVIALLPMAAIPFLIVGAASGFPGSLPLLGLFPFAFGIWFGVSLWRGRDPKKQAWLYVFTEGFLLLTGDWGAEAPPVRWNRVIEVTPVWTEVIQVGTEGETRPTLTAYRLRSADGELHEISRSFKNVRDPYREMGHLFRGLAPNTVGKAMPKFPTIDEILAAYARKPNTPPGYPAAQIP